MKFWKGFGLTIGLLLSVGVLQCASGVELDTELVPDLRAKIQARLEELGKFKDAKDVQSLEAAFLPECRIMPPHSDKQVHGHGPELTAILQNFITAPQIQHEVRDMAQICHKVKNREGLDRRNNVEHVAVTSGAFSLAQVPPHEVSKNQGPVTGKFIIVWNWEPVPMPSARKMANPVAGQLKIRWLIWNFDKPLPKQDTGAVGNSHLVKSINDLYSEVKALTDVQARYSDLDFEDTEEADVDGMSWGILAADLTEAELESLTEADDTEFALLGNFHSRKLQEERGRRCHKGGIDRNAEDAVYDAYDRLNDAIDDQDVDDILDSYTEGAQVMGPDQPAMSGESPELEDMWMAATEEGWQFKVELTEVIAGEGRKEAAVSTVDREERDVFALTVSNFKLKNEDGDLISAGQQVEIFSLHKNRDDEHHHSRKRSPRRRPRKYQPRKHQPRIGSQSLAKWGRWQAQWMLSIWNDDEVTSAN